MSLNVKKNLFFFSIILLNSFFSLSQQEIEHDDIKFSEYCNDVLNNAENKRKKELLIIADSLYSVAKNKKQKIAALITYYNVYANQNNFPKAIEALSKADSIAIAGDLFESRVTIKTALAQIYREMGLTNKGLEELEAALDISNRLPKKENSEFNLFNKSRLLNEKSLFLMAEKDTVNAKKALQASIDMLAIKDENRNNKKFYSYFFDSHLKLGYIHLEQQDFFSAKKEFMSCLALANKFHNMESEDVSICYNNLGVVAMEESKIDSAYHYFSKAEIIAKKFDNTFLMEHVYTNLIEYYLEVGDHRAADSIKSELLKIKLEKSDFNIQVSDKIIKENINTVKSKKTTINYLFLLIVGLVILTMSLYIYNRYSKKKRELYFKAFVEKIEKKKNEELTSPFNKVERQDEQLTKNTNFNISQTKEEEILNRLSTFERRNGFLDNKLSVASMASALDTNTKYLSYILKKHRGKSFVEYINSIRINYIVEELYRKPELSKYKISYLAELSGFSSHSRFTQIFKRETNNHPSDFINKLNCESLDHKKIE